MPIPRNLSIPGGGATRYTILRCSLNSDANPDPQPEHPGLSGVPKKVWEMLIGSELGGMMRVRHLLVEGGGQNPVEYILLRVYEPLTARCESKK